MSMMNLTEARLPFYQALRQAALAQQEALRSDDLETFQALMDEREELLASIERLGPFDPFDPSADAEASGRRQAASLLADIIKTDRELQRLLASRIEKVRADLARLRIGKQTARAYWPRTGTESLFIDVEG